MSPPVSLSSVYDLLAIIVFSCVKELLLLTVCLSVVCGILRSVTEFVSRSLMIKLMMKDWA